MTNNKNIILNQGKSLSQSLLWDFQYSIYNYYGPEAWSRAGVPSYMTSNPYTARQYAAIMLGFIRDCIKGIHGKSFDKTHPFYIFDLGAGTGRFGYLFLNELLKYLSQIHRDDIKIKYIMTDMIECNLHYLHHHPYLQEFIEKGIIDFTYYHTSFADQHLRLLVSGEEITPETIVNPIGLIGNYFFDVIPQDLFKVIDQQLCEGQVTLTIPFQEDVDVKNPHPSKLKDLKANYHYVPITKKNYYEDEIQESLLQYYANSYEGVSFTIPVAAFKTLKYFKKLSHDRLLLLAGDQGVSSDQQVFDAGEPEVSVQGGISISVSYHALAKFVSKQEGVAWLTSYPDSLFVNIAAVFGGTREAFPETDFAFESNFDYFQPSDYWKLTCCTETEWKTPTIEYLLLLIKMGNWDPLNFHAFFSIIRKQIPTASQKIKDCLAETIRQVWKKFFPTTSAEQDFVMNLGVLMFELGLFEEALVFFERAVTVGGHSHSTLEKNKLACLKALHRDNDANQNS